MSCHQQTFSTFSRPLILILPLIHYVLHFSQMAEGEKLKMIALSAQLSLEQVEQQQQQQQQQQQMDRSTTVDIKSWSTEDHNHTSDEQKRHIPR